MFAVALTGGIGSGKSTVSALFAGLGVTVVDADEVSHDLTAPGSAALPEIAAAFGRHMLQDDGGPDRAALRQLVFSDPASRRRLEGILHPRIRAEMLAQAARSRGPYVVLAIPLLFETGQTDIANRVLVVDSPEEQQIARVQARSGLSATEIQRIMASQVNRTERLAGADDIIDNSGNEADLQPQVQRLHQLYLQLSGAPPTRHI